MDEMYFVTGQEREAAAKAIRENTELRAENERLRAAAKTAVSMLENEADSLQEQGLSAGAAFALSVKDVLVEAGS